MARMHFLRLVAAIALAGATACSDNADVEYSYPNTARGRPGDNTFYTPDQTMFGDGLTLGGSSNADPEFRGKWHCCKFVPLESFA